MLTIFVSVLQKDQAYKNQRDNETLRQSASLDFMLVLCVVYAECLLYTFLSELLVLIKQVYYSKPNLSDWNKLAYLRAQVAWGSSVDWI